MCRAGAGRVNSDYDYCSGSGSVVAEYVPYIHSPWQAQSLEHLLTGSTSKSGKGTD